MSFINFIESIKYRLTQQTEDDKNVEVAFNSALESYLSNRSRQNRLVYIEVALQGVNQLKPFKSNGHWFMLTQNEKTEIIRNAMQFFPSELNKRQYSTFKIWVRTQILRHKVAVQSQKKVQYHSVQTVQSVMTYFLSNLRQRFITVK